MQPHPAQQPDPTPLEIAVSCSVLQHGWTEKQRRAREGLGQPPAQWQSTYRQPRVSRLLALMQSHPVRVRRTLEAELL